MLAGYLSGHQDFLISELRRRGPVRDKERRKSPIPLPPDQRENHKKYSAGASAAMRYS